MAVLKVKFEVHQEIKGSSSNMGIISNGREIQPFFVILGITAKCMEIVVISFRSAIVYLPYYWSYCKEEKYGLGNIVILIGKVVLRFSGKVI